MLKLRRPAIALLVLLTLWPTVVLGQSQAPPKAGIVTTLEGRATATRVVLPQPVALNFKDDVFLNDEITTAEKSLARILLGGKAVVTIRERSSLTITEVPGLSTIEIASGKIALAVARERLRPGEQIQIRTPNAITGIRGTSLVVEVIRSIADTRRPDPNVTTTLGVFHGDVVVEHINPLTRARLAAPVNVGVNMKFSAAGIQPATVRPFEPGDAARFQAGVTPAGPRHVEAANAEQLADQAKGTADTLLRAVLDPAGPAAIVVTPPPLPIGSPPPITQTITGTPILPGENGRGGSPSILEGSGGTGGGTETGGGGGGGNGGGGNNGGSTVTFPSNITVDGGLTLGAPGASTVVNLPAGSAPQTSGSYFVVGTEIPSPAELAIPLLTVTNGALTVVGHLLDVRGTLTSTTTSPLLSFDPTSVVAIGDFVRVEPGATLNLNGALMTDTGGTLQITGSIVAVETDGSVTSKGGAPLIALDGTTLHASSMLSVDGGTARMTGPLLVATNSTIVADSLVALRGGEFASNGPSALFQLTGSDVDAATSLIQVSGLAATVAGPLLRSQATTITTGSGSLLAINGDLHVGPDGAGAALNFFDSVVSTGTEIVFVGPNGRLRVERGLIHAENTSFTTSTFDTFFTIARGGTVSASTASPFIDLRNSPVTMQQGEDFIHVGSTVGGGIDRGVLTVTGGGPLVRLDSTQFDLRSGSLLRVTGSDVLMGGPILDTVNTTSSFDGAVITLGAGSTFTSTLGPVFKVSGGSLRADSLLATDGSNSITVAGTILDLANNASVTLTTFSRATERLLLPRGVNEPLLRLSSSALTLLDPDASIELGVASSGTTVTQTGVGVIATGTAAAPSKISTAADLLFIQNATLTDSNPQLQLTRTQVTQTGDVQPSLVEVFGNASITGPLLSATASIFDVGALLNIESGQLTTTGPGGALLQLANSTVTAGVAGIIVTANLGLNRGLLDVIDSTFTVRDGSLLDVSVGGSVTTTGTSAPLLRFTGTAADRSSVTASTNFVRLADGASSLALSGPLLAATLTNMANGDPATNAHGFVFVADGATVSSPTDQPLITLDRSTVTTSGSFFTARRSGSTLTTVSVNGPLLAVADGSIRAFSSALTDVNGNARTCCSLFALSQGAQFVGQGQSALMSLVGTSVNAGDFLAVLSDFANIQGETLRARATLSLRGPLLSAIDAQITTVRDFLGVFSSTLTSATPNPLVSITRGSVTVGDNGGFFTFALSIGGTSAPVVSLAGPLLSATATKLANGDPAASPHSFVFVGDGARLSSATTDALLALNQTSVNTSGSLVTVRRPGDTPSFVQLAGPLIRATDSSIVASTTALRTTSGAPLLCCNLLSVGQGALFTSSSAAPLIDLLRTDVTVGDRLVDIFDVTSIAGEAPIAPAAAALNLAGPLVKTVGGNITGSLDLLAIIRSSVQSTTPDPLIAVDGTTVTMGGRNPFDGTLTDGRLVLMQAGTSTPSTPTPAILGLHGPLFNANNAVITTTADAFSFFNGARVTSTTDNPLITISGGSVTAGAQGTFLGLASVAGQLTSSMSLNGPLLRAAATTLTNGDPASNLVTFIFVGQSATLSSTTAAALLSFDSTTVNTAGNILTLRDSTSAAAPSTITLNGPLVSASNSRFNTPRVSTFFVGEGGRLTSSSALPLIDLVGTTATAAFDFFTVTDVFIAQPLPATVGLASALLNAKDSTINVANDLLGVTRSTVRSSTTTDSLIQLDGATVNAGGSAIRVVDGQLLAATVPAVANLLRNATVTTGSHAVDISGASANVELKDVVRLTNSTVTVNAGSLVNVAGGRLDVAGNLLSLFGNSSVTIRNGLLLDVSGGSVNIGGVVVTFKGGANTVNVTNTVVPNFFAAGIPIFVQPGTPSPIINPSALVGLGGTNVINVCNGTACTSLNGSNATTARASLISVRNGATLRVGPGAL